jgi:hypothetical protein
VNPRHLRSLLYSAVAVTLLALPFASRAVEPTLPAPAPAAVETIQPTEMKANLTFLSSPELGGRYTLSPGFAIAARYLATRLQSYGYVGAGKDGSFFQRFDLNNARVLPDSAELILRAEGKSKTYRYGAFFNSASVGADLEAPVVFAGYGISAKRLDHDDYDRLDVKGKIVLILGGGVPKGLDPSRLADDEAGTGAAAAHGAVGVMYLPRSFDLSAMKRDAYRDRSLESVRLAAASSRIPAIRLQEETANDLLKPLGASVKDLLADAKEGKPIVPRPTGARVRLKLEVEVKVEPSQNVVGWLPGTDPALRDEYVMISAHYDHLRTNAKGEYYPGADDDGSGTVAVLNIARAMAMDPPRRSVLIIFHAGEELGLLGSAFNADIAPIRPLEKMVANFNIDMIGRSKKPGDGDPRNQQMTPPDTIYVIGADRTSKELHRINEQTNQEFEKLRFDYLLNDPRHPDQIFFRSDHWNYGKHGVPFIFYFDGVGEDYHQPSDTEDKIDYEKLTRVSRLVFQVSWRVASLDHRIAAD